MGVKVGSQRSKQSTDVYFHINTKILLTKRNSALVFKRFKETDAKRKGQETSKVERLQERF